MVAARKTFRPWIERLEDRVTPANVPGLVPPPLNSLPGAPATIYLDFNGHFDATWGSATNVDTPPFSLDSTLNTYSAAETQMIQDIWRHVAEDFAPFRVNVTTVEPPSFAIKVALRVAIGGDGAWLGAQAGGVAFINSFGTGSGVTPTCFAFPPNVSNNAKNIADVSSHEAGHMFGLQHQSSYNGSGSKSAEYYGGLGDGTAPVMGVSYGVTRSLWWNGTPSNSSSQLQDDVVILSNSTNGFGYRADDHGNNAGGATLLKAKGLGTATVTAQGNIHLVNDADWFKFTAKPGAATFTVDVPDPYNNLDPIIELRNNKGQVIATANPATTFDATVTFNLTSAGTYFVVVASAGPSSSSTANNRGTNIGTYTLNGSFVPLGEPIKIFSPMRYRYRATNGVYSGVVTIKPPSFTVSGPISLQIILPQGVEWVAPAGTQVGNVVTITLNKDLKKGQGLKFGIKLKNPNKVDLGTFYNGFVITAG
jgi:hypothetical protein